jgi:predicted TIM-barrel fold metal-dependent hydrolase
VKIIMAHLGHPYEGECVATFRKHPNVYADVSALHYRPFQLYHSLMLVQEYGVWNKVLLRYGLPVHQRQREHRRHPQAERHARRHETAAAEER